MPAGGHPLMQQVCEAIEDRARALLSGLEDDAPHEPAPSAPAAAKRKPKKPRQISARTP
jgi:hypothetical protein